MCIRTQHDKAVDARALASQGGEPSSGDEESCLSEFLDLKFPTTYEGLSFVFFLVDI
jgi:hypothetical protein